MGFKVIWSDQAIQDLRELCAYIARHDPEAALRMGNGILDHVDILAQFPFIGPPYPRGTGEAVFEVERGVELRESQGLKVRELARAEALATEHQELILQRWHERFNR